MIKKIDIVELVNICIIPSPLNMQRDIPNETSLRGQEKFNNFKIVEHFASCYIMFG